LAEAVRVTQVAMESSGVYWKPVWNILEGKLTVVLANAQHIKNVPGRKTDQKDAGKSGRAMLEEIVAGQDDPEYLASLALGHFRAKTPQLRVALEGKIRPHHRFLLSAPALT
jgi:transposase